MAGRLSRTEKRFLNPDELDIYKHLRGKYLGLAWKSVLVVVGLFLICCVIILFLFAYLAKYFYVYSMVNWPANPASVMLSAIASCGMST